MKKLLLLLGLAAALPAASLSIAAENATGSWKWTFTTQNGDAIESTAKLKQEDGKLTGTVTGRLGEAEISEGTVKGEDVAFKIKREREGQTFVVQYKGKIAGDKLVGKIELDREGQSRSWDWEAKRLPAKTLVAGAWNCAITLPDGNRMEGTLTLKQDGEKLTGNVARGSNESGIEDGRVMGDEIAFKVVREREGRTITSKYKAKISGDSLKGKVESDWSGDWTTLEWEGSRAK